MRKFIKKCLLFAICIWVFNLPLYLLGEYLYLKGYKKHSLTFRSYLLADSHGLPLSTLLEESGIYNFSAGSESYHDMKRKLSFLIHNTKVDTVVITINDHTLSSYREKSNNLDRSIYYSTKEDYNNYYTFFKAKVSSNVSLLQPKKSKIIFEHVKTNVANLFKGNRINSQIKIEQWGDLTLEDKKIFALRRFNEHFEGTFYSEELFKELDDIIEICKRKQIVLIGVLFPLSKEYLDLLGECENEAVKLFEKKGLMVLDFKKKFQDDSTLFFNQDHLNLEGGKKLSEMIISQIK
jgi:hypothetical protein